MFVDGVLVFTRLPLKTDPVAGLALSSSGKANNQAWAPYGVRRWVLASEELVADCVYWQAPMMRLGALDFTADSPERN
jgi:hypothetical protein